MKKKLALMASMLLASAMGGTDVYDVKYPVPRVKGKASEKKCKSCKHIRKEYNPCRCAINGYTSPMHIACNHYEKQKK